MFHSATSLSPNQQFRVVAVGLGDPPQQSAVAAKSFAPMINFKTLYLQFTICLESAVLLYDGSKIPSGKGADWKPSHAIAYWAHCSKDETTGKMKPSSTKMFNCKHAACLRTSGVDSPNLLAVWSSDEGTSATAEIKKELRHKAGDECFEDQFIQITLFAAYQKYRKDGSPQMPSQACDGTKPIKLAQPFLINLSVSSFDAAFRLLFFPHLMNNFRTLCPKIPIFHRSMKANRTPVQSNSQVFDSALLM